MNTARAWAMCTAGLFWSFQFWWGLWIGLAVAVAASTVLLLLVAFAVELYVRKRWRT